MTSRCQIATVPSVYLHAANRCPRAKIHYEKNCPWRPWAAAKKQLFGEVEWVRTRAVEIGKSEKSEIDLNSDSTALVLVLI